MSKRVQHSTLAVGTKVSYVSSGKRRLATVVGKAYGSGSGFVNVRYDTGAYKGMHEERLISDLHVVRHGAGYYR